MLYELNHQEAEAQFKLACFWLAKGNIATAIAGFQKALELNPQHPLASTYLARSQQSDQHVQADDIEPPSASARKTELEDGNRYLNLATFWQVRKQIAPAIFNYEKAIQYQPHYLPAYLELCHLHRQANQPEQIAQVCQHAIAQHPTEPWLPFFLGDLFSIPQPTQPPTIAKRNSTKSRHILLYTNCPGIFGAEQISHALMLRLIDAGYQVTCVQSKASNRLINARTKLGIKHIWLKDNAHKFMYAVSNVAEAIAIFTQAAPDLILFADGDPMSDLGANWAAQHLGIPFIRIVHCVIPKHATLFANYLPLLPKLYQAAKAIVSVSHANLDLMREQFRLPQTLGQVIYNGRSDQFFIPPDSQTRQRIRQALQIPQDAIVCFTAARLDEVKGYQHQLNAIAQLQKTELMKHLYFVWAGTGAMESQIKAQIAQLGMTEQIKLLGDRADVADLLDAADLFILPSHAEGMPLSIMEAMSKGLPIMATAVSGIPEQLGDTGQLLCDPNLDPAATVQAIVETLQIWGLNPELRQYIGQACQRRAMSRFREQQMLAHYLDLIEQSL